MLSSFSCQVRESALWRALPARLRERRRERERTTRRTGVAASSLWPSLQHRDGRSRRKLSADVWGRQIP